MVRRDLLTGFLSTCTALIAGKAASQETPGANFIGAWSGLLALGSISLRLRLEIGADKGVNLFSIDQGADPIKARVIKLNDSEISLQFAAINARFSGTKTGNQIIGTFRQGPNSSQLTFYSGAETGFAIVPNIAPLTQMRLNQLREAAQSPALVAAAQMRGKPALSMVSGKRASTGEIAAQTDDKWHLGSITKSMTAVLTAKLIERGIIKWDSKIGDILGDKIPTMRNEYKQVTVLHLLSHQSGLPANLSILHFLEFHNSKRTIIEDRIEFAKISLEKAPVGAMGNHFEYSNCGFVVLGAMLEAVSGKSWEELLVAELFTPLGMTSAGFGPPGTKDLLDAPLGHSKALFGDQRKPAQIGGSGFADNPKVLGPAGTVHASAADVVKYLAAHRDYAPILRRESWGKLHQVHFGGNYACGLIKKPDGGLWHNGSNTLWYAEISIDPQNGLCGFACANDGYLPLATQEVGDALLGISAAAKIAI